MTTETGKRTESALPTLEVWWSKGNRILFLRLTEEDKNDENLVGLYRLLELHNIDTERAMNRFGQLRAMKLPRWIVPILKDYYNLDWLSDKEVVSRLKE